MSPEQWQKLEEIYEQALALPAAERKDFVIAACDGDVELQEEILSLLATHDEISDHFLSESALAHQVAETVKDTVSIPPPNLSGQQIGKFTLIERLGIGGMGEVYLARDAQLSRKVALKLLRAQVTENDAKVRRFLREARAASALNHPNILTVFEIGQENGRHFIASEYVEGVTLRARLQQGSIPLNEVVSITDQVAAALEQAHAAGIIHRDIKPENLMLRPDGSVKVLDFGIAKLTENTNTSGLTYATESGLILGTPGYMSPEQARAQAITTQSDLFSLGVVLYEMLAGELPFKANTQADFLVQLLTVPPIPVSQIRPDLPRAYYTLVEQLLAKEPAARIANATETRAALNRLPVETTGYGQQLVARFVLPWLRWPRPVWAAGILLAMALATWVLTRPSPAPELIWSHSGQLRPKDIYSSKTEKQFDHTVFSPNGQWIAFSLREGEYSHIYIANRFSKERKRLSTQASNDRQPVWSPDGQQIAYLAAQGNKTNLWRVNVSTGAAATIKESMGDLSTELVAWRAPKDGEKIYYASSGNLHELNLNSGQIKPVTQLTGQCSSFSLSPDGERLLYREAKNEARLLQMLTLSNNRVQTIASSNNGFGFAPQWFADGQHIVFGADASGNFQPQIYSLATGTTQAINYGNLHFASVSVAPDGKALVAASQTQFANVYSVGLKTGELGHTSEAGSQLFPALIDKQTLLYHLLEGTTASNQQKLLMEKTLNSSASANRLIERVYTSQLSPDGQQIAFSRYQEGLFLYSRSTKQEHLLAKDLQDANMHPLPYDWLTRHYAWSPDGKRLIFASKQPSQWGYNLVEINLADRNTKALLSSAMPLPITFPVYSPDQQHIAFISKGQKEKAEGQAFRLFAFSQGNLTRLHETEGPSQILGWLPTTGEILLAYSSSSQSRVNWQTVTLLTCHPQTLRCQQLKSFEQAYLPSFCLSPDGQAVAFVSQRHNASNLSYWNLAASKETALTNQTDPGVYFSGLTWAPDSQQLFFSKQTNFEKLILLEP